MAFKLKFKNIYIKIKLLIISALLILINFVNKKKIKIGVIGILHSTNIGNNLLKFAMFTKLLELGYDPYIIGVHPKNSNISFLNRTTNLIIIKNSFSEIKRNDYDILMVNSDQTWRKFDRHFYDYAFLNFSRNWKIPKFIYGASLGYDYWTFTKKDEDIAKKCLKNFNNISVREINSIKLIENNLSIKPTFVLDPTLLIDKKYYLDIIKNYKSNININNYYIFIYLFDIKKVIKFISTARKKLNYNIYSVTMKDDNYIEKFIYGIVNCKSVITDSFHGTLFSIIFNKPFISFINKNSANARFISLKNILNLNNRIFFDYQTPKIDLLTTPLKINYNLINKLKTKSIKYLKKNLRINIRNGNI